jgi:hypothetical protein
MPTKAGTSEPIMKTNRKLGFLRVTIPTIRNHMIGMVYCGMVPLRIVSRLEKPKDVQTSLPKVVLAPFGSALTMVTKKKK